MSLHVYQKCFNLINIRLISNGIEWNMFKSFVKHFGSILGKKNFYSLMFMDYQNFDGSLGCNFVLVRVTHEILEHLFSVNNDDSTVYTFYS